MGLILSGLLSFIAGAIYMMRGGSTWLPKVPRWATVLMQLVVIVPFLLLYHLPLWIAPIYCVGWYLTIMQGWAGYFDCKTWPKRETMFWRMCESIVLFYPLSCAIGKFVPFMALGHTVAFAAITVFIYWLYNRQTGHTDTSFNWSEFATGALLAGLTFNLLGA